jgi:hypothetical protein
MLAIMVASWAVTYMHDIHAALVMYVFFSQPGMKHGSRVRRKFSTVGLTNVWRSLWCQPHRSIRR